MKKQANYNFYLVIGGQAISSFLEQFIDSIGRIVMPRNKKFRLKQRFQYTGVIYYNVNFSNTTEEGVKKLIENLQTPGENDASLSLLKIRYRFYPAKSKL
jgi:hypothetical protein